MVNAVFRIRLMATKCKGCYFETAFDLDVLVYWPSSVLIICVLPLKKFSIKAVFFIV